MDFGVGKSLIASKYLGNGSIDDSVMRKPAKSTVKRANWNFSGFRMIQFWPQRMR